MAVLLAQPNSSGTRLPREWHERYSAKGGTSLPSVLDITGPLHARCRLLAARYRILQNMFWGASNGARHQTQLPPLEQSDINEKSGRSYTTNVTDIHGHPNHSNWLRYAEDAGAVPQTHRLSPVPHAHVPPRRQLSKQNFRETASGCKQSRVLRHAKQFLLRIQSHRSTPQRPAPPLSRP